MLHRRKERAPSRGEVLEVSSAAKGIEREALRIRLRSIIDEFEHKGTNKRAQSKEKIKLFIAFVERERSATKGDACSEGLKKVKSGDLTRIGQ